MSRKVLVITEGPKDELHLLKSLCRDIGLTESEVDIFSYKTDFHNFARLIFPEGTSKPDDTIDVLLELKSHEKDEAEQEILSGQYTDIYMVFDFDPHVSKPDFEKMRILADYFTEFKRYGTAFHKLPYDAVV